MNIIKKIFFISLFLYFPHQSMAWGVLGHRIVGQIADSYLTPKAKKEIAAILGHESIAMASNWPDFVKSDTSFSYLSKWHFVNLLPAQTNVEIENYLNADTLIDAYTKINFCIAEIKKKSLPNDKKIFYLRILIHLVGDVHQPLHVGRLADLGGNKLKLLWFKDTTNLHQIWDEKLISFQDLSYTEYANAINFVSIDNLRIWQNQPVRQWIVDSYNLVEKIYADINQPYQRLDYKYNYNYVALLNEQLLKGGVHLAALLNSIYG